MKARLSMLWRVADGQAIPRPARRRLVREGLVNEDMTLTPSGTQWILDTAPRSAWKAPRVPGQTLLEVRSSRGVLMALTMAAAISTPRVK